MKIYMNLSKILVLILLVLLEQSVFMAQSHYDILSHMLNKTNSSIIKLAKHNSIPMIDSVIVETTSDTRYAYYFTFNTNNNILEIIGHRWNDNQGAPWNRTLYGYNSEGVEIWKNTYGWNGTGWNASYKYFYTYGDSGLLDSILIKDITASWEGINKSLITYTYEVYGKIKSALSESWRNNTWEKEYEEIYNYNAENKLETESREWWDNNNLSDRVTFSYEYDDNNRLSQKTYNSHGELTQQNYTYDYLDRLQLEVVKIKWEGMDSLSNRYYIQYFYDIDHNLIEKLTKVWTSIDWRNYTKIEYQYDGMNNLKYMANYYWENNKEVWEFNSDNLSYYDSDGRLHSQGGSELKIYYDNITKKDDESELPKEFILSQNYPNPFNPTTIINYTIPNVGNENFHYVQLKVYDILGKEVAILVNETKQPGNHKVEFNASNLTSGVYFYRLKAGSFVETKKMVLLR